LFFYLSSYSLFIHSSPLSLFLSLSFSSFLHSFTSINNVQQDPHQP
jgi:hypothetical protein